MITDTLKGNNMDRSPIADSTAQDPLFTAVRPASIYTLAWANFDQVYVHISLGYEVVRPNEVEAMVGGQYMPHDKDFGMYFMLDKKADTVRIGQHILMKASKTMIEARRQRERDTMLRLKPKRNDPAEGMKGELQGETTLKRELGKIQED